MKGNNTQGHYDMYTYILRNVNGEIPVYNNNNVLSVFYILLKYVFNTKKLSYIIK